MMISIAVLLVLIRTSTADFTPARQASCYDIVGLEGNKFKFQYSDQVNFAPEKLIMKHSYFIMHHEAKYIKDLHENYTVKRKTDGTCDDMLYISKDLGTTGYQSTYFVSFFFGNYLVEHFIIKPGIMEAGTVFGTMGRASLKTAVIISENGLLKPKIQESLVYPDLGTEGALNAYVLTFMNYAQPGIVHIIRNYDSKIKFPGMAIFKITLVDKKSKPVKGILPIIDLVKIEIAAIPKNKINLFYSQGLKDNLVEIRILNVDGKEITKAKYPLTQQKFGDAKTSKSDFNFNGVTPTEIIENSSKSFLISATLPSGYNKKALQFMKTTDTLETCKVNSKEAFVLKRMILQDELSRESRCSEQTKESAKILYHGPCTDDRATKCKKGSSL